MSTDLRAALREAVADEPFDSSDVYDVVAAGSRRVRRRTAWAVGTSALAMLVVAVVVAAVTAGSGGSRPVPRPAHVVRLDVDQAPTQDLDVLASVRTTWREPMDDLDRDRFLGLTDDGLVLRSRVSHDGDLAELGLLDPGSGRTDWLPPPPDGAGDAEDVVALTADRLVLLSRGNGHVGTLLTFDRRSATWRDSELRLPAGLEVHVSPRRVIGPDGRLYLGNNLEGEAGPLRWWSYPVPEGGRGRPETALTGAAVAWVGDVQARADGDGRVVVATDGSERVVSEARPAGCEPPADPDLADLPVLVGLAADRPVVTYWCGDGADALTVVYPGDDEAAVEVADARLLAADDGHVLLATPGGGTGAIHLLDLDPLRLTRIGPGLHDDQHGLAGGLVLLNRPGPLDAEDVYDVVWQVARLTR